MAKWQVLWVVLYVAIACSAAMGDDIHPPPWRGQNSTTSQVWKFSTPLQLNIPPDCAATGGQPPLASTMIIRILTGTQPPFNQYLPAYNGRMGVWPLSGLMDVIIDDHNPPNDVKMVWVQVTWTPQDPGEVPIFESLNPLPVEPPKLLGITPLPDGWFHSTYYWEIRPNPPDEKFTLTGTINVDELIVDTWCIPEPTTMTLAALGAGALAFLRKRFGR